jgi:dsDNA-specific endonuclease/ATPase MutS2
MMAVTAVAGLALVSGCKKSDVQEQRQDVAEAQQEAAKETAEARQDAAKETADTRQDAAKETAEAQDDAQQHIAEANRDSQERINDAQQDVREEQKDLAEAEHNQAEDNAVGGSGMAGTSTAAGASAAATTVMGRVMSTSGDMLTLVDTNNRELKLKTSDATRVLGSDSRAMKLDDIKEGSQVRASYVLDGKDMRAQSVTLVAPVKKLDK